MNLIKGPRTLHTNCKDISKKYHENRCTYIRLLKKPLQLRQNVCSVRALKHVLRLFIQISQHLSYTDMTTNTCWFNKWGNVIIHTFQWRFFQIVCSIITFIRLKACVILTLTHDIAVRSKDMTGFKVVISLL